jgi:short subunit dehydrogenase-like uncharacterized protein
MSGGDPGYDETSKMLAECAFILAFEQLGIAGSFSPSAAMGNHLVKRFEDAGLKIETSETNKLIQ